MRTLFLLSAVSWLGCVAAPREGVVTLELGAQQVAIDVQLRDIRANAGDDLSQLRLFEGVHAWKPEWNEDTPWGPTPTKFVFTADAGRLDLQMQGSMTRAQFDGCARSTDGGCPKFPLALGSGGYVMPASLVGSLKLDPKQPTHWPADTKKIVFRFEIPPKEAKFLDESGVSLARGFALFGKDPIAAEQTVKRAAQLEAAFRDQPLKDWLKSAEAEAACSDEPWCGLRQEAIRREQANLLSAWLKTTAEGGLGLRAPPEPFGFSFESRYNALLPKEKLPLVDELRLRVAYDVMTAEFAEKGSLTGPVQGLSTACQGKKGGLRDFCARLGVRK